MLILFAGSSKRNHRPNGDRSFFGVNAEFLKEITKHHYALSFWRFAKLQWATLGWSWAILLKLWTNIQANSRQGGSWGFFMIPSLGVSEAHKTWVCDVWPSGCWETLRIARALKARKICKSAHLFLSHALNMRDTPRECGCRGKKKKMITTLKNILNCSQVLLEPEVQSGIMSHTRCSASTWVESMV